jgi:hypothetical protein
VPISGADQGHVSGKPCAIYAPSRRTPVGNLYVHHGTGGAIVGASGTAAIVYPAPGPTWTLPATFVTADELVVSTENTGTLGLAP